MQPVIRGIERIERNCLANRSGGFIVKMPRVHHLRHRVVHEGKLGRQANRFAGFARGIGELLEISQADCEHCVRERIVRIGPQAGAQLALGIAVAALLVKQKCALVGGVGHQIRG
jgi:hypothetical protein